MEIFYFLKSAAGYKSPPYSQIVSKEVDLRNCYIAPLWIANGITENIMKEGGGLFFLDEYQKMSLLNKYSTPVSTCDIYMPNGATSHSNEIINILVVGGIGPAIGDAMNCLAAIRIFRNQIKNQYKQVNIYLQTSHVDYIRKYVENSGLIKEIYTAAIPAVNFLSKIDMIYSFESAPIKQAFNTSDMLSYFLDGFGIKECYNYTSRELVRPMVSAVDIPHAGERQKLLFNFSASSQVRSMDLPTATGKINDLIEKTDYQIVLFKKDALFDNAYKNNSRVTFVKASTFEEYCYVISKMDKIITVDTSTYHVAETFKIPTVVMFTTINPTLRISRYKYCVGYTVDEELLATTAEVWQKHFSSRNTKLIEKVAASFAKVDIIDVVKVFNQINS